MINIPDDIKKLINKYEEENNKKPRGWNYKEETLTQYKEYLEKQFKKDVLSMQVGEDWNKLKEKYNISKYEWDNEMKQHFDRLLGKYSEFVDYRKRK